MGGEARLGFCEMAEKDKNDRAATRTLPGFLVSSVLTPSLAALGEAPPEPTRLFFPPTVPQTAKNARKGTPVAESVG